MSPPPPPAMLKICCDTPEQVDQVWRMLAHVPFEDFQPVEVWVCGQLQYVVLRTDSDEQTTAPPEAQQACSRAA
jgi:hypothetical protein